MRPPHRAPSSYLPLAGASQLPGWTRTTNPPVNSRMLCQLSYRGRQPRDCSRAFRGALRGGRRRAGRTRAHASLRRRRRRGVHWRPRVRSQRARGQCSRRRSPGRAPRPRVRPWSRRRRARAADDQRARFAFQRAKGIRATGLVGRGTQTGARRAGSARCSASASSGSARSAGTSRCSSSGCGATGSARERWTAGSRASTGVALRRYQSRRGLAPDGIAGPKTYRSLAGRGRHASADDLARRARRARASSRSLRATTSARGGSLVATGCR